MSCYETTGSGTLLQQMETIYKSTDGHSFIDVKGTGKQGSFDYIQVKAALWDQTDKTKLLELLLRAFTSTSLSLSLVFFSAPPSITVISQFLHSDV